MDVPQQFWPLLDEAVPLPQAQAAAGSKKRARSAAHASSGATAGPTYRGVSQHRSGARFEAHVWKDNRQIYLGGSAQPEVAALAFDLASVHIRGESAHTNLPLWTHFAAELRGEGKPSFDDLVLSLRNTMKSMQALNPAPAFILANQLTDWELDISSVVSGAKSLGVYASEREAARAADRALLRRDGLAAAGLLNFPLVDYIDLLDAAQICQALQQGLLPQTVPRSWAPAPEPRPIKRVRRATSAAAAPCITGLPPMQAALEGKPPVAAAAAAGECCIMAPPLPAPIPRRASTTPRLPPQPLLEDVPADLLA